MDYERWLFSSSLSDYYYKTIIKVDAEPKEIMKCTRIDIAFDFECNANYYPKDFTQEHLEHIIKKYPKIKLEGPGTRGPEITGTRYIGKRTSSKYLRIYRKDIKDCINYPTPTLRLEIELKGEVGNMLLHRAMVKGYKHGYEIA